MTKLYLKPDFGRKGIGLIFPNLDAEIEVLSGASVR